MGLGEKKDPAKSFLEAEAFQMSLLTVSFRGVLSARGPRAGCFCGWCVALKAFLHPWPGKVGWEGNAWLLDVQLPKAHVLAPSEEHGAAPGALRAGRGVMG